MWSFLRANESKFTMAKNSVGEEYFENNYIPRVTTHFKSFLGHRAVVDLDPIN